MDLKPTKKEDDEVPRKLAIKSVKKGDADTDRAMRSHRKLLQQEYVTQEQ